MTENPQGAVPTTTAAIADHGLIASLGVGSILNVPLRRADGSNWGTVNLCGAEGSYTPERVALAERIIDELAPPEPVTTDSEGAPA